MVAAAQPPGTTPDRDVLDRAGENPDGLSVEAFLFLSEAQSQVFMPRLTWEEFDRLRKLESGIRSASQVYSYRSMSVQGSVQDNRAELQISLKLRTESTANRWVPIPIRMRNFHQLAPPDVSGVDDYFMALGPDDDRGYVLFVKTDREREVTLRMRVSARVNRLASAQTLEFQLPDVPTTVELMTDSVDVVGDVIGGGNEVVKPATESNGQTKLTVETVGGDFAVRWGKQSKSDEELPLLEVESRLNVRWDSPQAQPLASVQMTVRNVRGAIRSFPLRLPAGTVVLESPRLGTSGQSIDLADTSDGGIREIVIPEEEQQERIDLNFDLQLANDEASASDPLLFRVPDIPGALRHTGEIEIETNGDYRLQWRSKAWVRSQLGEAREEGVAGRAYRFRYDRSSFELPLWLGMKERQLRINSQSQMVIREAMASLEMTITISGQATDGRLRFDDADWQISSIESTATGEQLQSLQAGDFRLIEFNPAAGEDSAPIRIRAERVINEDDSQIVLGIPRVLSFDDTVLVQNATMNIVSSGRTMLVVDLDASTGVTRIIPSASEATTDSPISRFRVMSQEDPVIVVGSLIDQLPRIAMASQSTVELDGRQLRTTIDWDISSGLDLEGALPVRIPGLTDGLLEESERIGLTSSNPGGLETASLAPASSVVDDGSTADATPRIPAGDSSQVGERWVVTVGGVRAELRQLQDERYLLVSPKLSSGSMRIRWQSTKNLPVRLSNGSIESIAMPRPDFPDVTLRGSQSVTLQGNQDFELVSADPPRGTDLQLESIPRDPLRIRFQSRLTSREELSIRQTMLRTVVGRVTRHEQVIAELQGGDQFRVELPETTGDVSVEAYIDNTIPVPVRREGKMLQIALPGDKARHVVDLRVWLESPAQSSLETIRPVLKLPIGSGRVYWQIVAPLDGHVLWASPTLGRSMTWRFDDWRLYREPTFSNTELRNMFSRSADVAAPGSPLPPGNPYLYVGSDTRSFEVIVVSRVTLWLAVSSMVLASAVVLTLVPRSRHPLTVVVAAILFSGLLAIAPDAAVLAGQFGIIALVLVIVMIAIRVLLKPSTGGRVFSSSQKPEAPSTRSLKAPPNLGVSSTQALPATASSEATS